MSQILTGNKIIWVTYGKPQKDQMVKLLSYFVKQNTKYKPKGVRYEKK